MLNASGVEGFTIVGVIVALAMLRFIVSPWFRAGFLHPPDVEPAWRIAASKLALEPSFVRRGHAWWKTMLLPVRGRSAELLVRSSGDPTGRALLKLDARGLLPAGLRIRGLDRFQAEKLRDARLRDGIDNDELTVFEDSIEVIGNQALRACLLERGTRHLLRISIFELGFVVQDGFVHYEANDLDNNYVQLVQVLSRMTALGNALAIDESSVFSRLVAIIESDDAPEIRAHVLSVLGFSFPRERTEAIFRAARKDSSPRVRLEALMGAGSVTIEELLSVLTDPMARRKTMLEAGRLALRVLDRDTVEDALHKLFTGSAPLSQELRAMLIGALGRIRSERSAPALAAILEQSGWPLRIEAVEALGHLSMPEYADLIARELAHPHAELRAAAARALGQCGTIAHVPLLKSADLPAKLADSAVSRIAARHGAPLSGALALISGEATGGELALHRTEGALSTVDS